MTTPTPPARLHAIVAREAPVAVVFRRGPSKQVQMLCWDLKADQVTPGQWLKHRAYAEGADLSPDGRHLIYNAATHNPGHAVASSYVAISKPPFFTAIALYPTPGFDEGGGLFLDNRRFWAGAFGKVAGGEDLLRSNGLRRVPTFPAELRSTGRADTPWMQRNGWQTAGYEAQRDAYVWTWNKPLAPGWALRQTLTRGLRAHRAGPHGNWIWSGYAVLGPDGGGDLRVDWADAWQGELLFARDGCLYRQPPGGSSRQIADLNANRFRPVRAPYQGVEIARQYRKHWRPLDGGP